MANFVTIQSEFEVYKNMFLERFNNVNFENNPFNKNYKYFLGFEFDFIFDTLFFDGLNKFINKLGDNSSVFYTIAPYPENYYYEYFSNFSVFEISSFAPYEELIDILTEDPGNSPADELCTNTNEIAWFSKSKKWAIIGSRDWEITIVGFTDLSLKKQFIESFSQEANTMFTTVEQQTIILDEMLNFSKETKEVYKKISKNYVNRD